MIMIRKTQQKRLKKILGNEYTEGVLKILQDKKITNRLGNPHSAEHIINVFTGFRNNADVEAAIYELAQKRQSESEQSKLKYRKILSTKKPDAVTSGN